MRSVISCRYWGLFFVFLFLTSALTSCNKEVTVPDVRGMSESAAAAAIEDAGLTVGTTSEQYSSTVPAGQVISQNPAAGASLAPDTMVTFILSRGPQPVDVPDLVGMTEDAAQTAIEEAGLALGTADYLYSDTVPAGAVIDQDPEGGTSVAPNSAVALVVSNGPEPVAVPNVVDMRQSAAQETIEAAGLTVSAITQDFSDTVPNGMVISQEPSAGVSVLPGSAVSFVVSKGPEPVEVPDVEGLSEAEAQAAIENADLTVGNVDRAYSDTVPEGQVSSQDPAEGTSVPPDTAVNFVVSDGPEPVDVPNVVGMTESAAQAAITDADLVVGTVDYAFSDTVPEGQVISQDPLADTSVLPDTPVALVVSKGPDLVTVPDVVGMTEQAAETTLTAERLQVFVTHEYSDTVPEGEVISQNPEAGESVEPDTVVRIVVSKGQQLGVVVPNVLGMTQSDAEDAIRNAGLRVGTVTNEYTETVPAHQVMNQTPAAGTSVEAGSEVRLGVSKGLPMADSETEFEPTRELETVELEEGLEIEAAAREVLLSVKRDITAEQMLELIAWLESQGFTVVGHSAQSSMLQIQTPLKSLKLNKSLFDSFEDHEYIISAGPNMVCDMDSVEALYEDPAQIGIVRDNEAGYLYGQSIEMPAVPRALLWKDTPAITWTPTGFDGEWWIDAISAPEAWELSTGNPDVIIGIADNGFDPDGTLETDRVTLMYGDGSAGSDVADHGTFVTGLAAGDGDPVGTEDTVGVAWKTDVVFVTCFPSWPGIWMFTDIVAGINTAIENDARVVNASWGGLLGIDSMGTEENFLAVGQQFRESMTGTVDYARQEQVLVCFSAGNDGFGMDRNHHPPIDRDGDGVADVDATTTSSSTPTPNYVPGTTVRQDDLVLPDDSEESDYSWSTNALIVGAAGSGVLTPDSALYADKYTPTATDVYWQAPFFSEGRIAQFSRLGDVVNLIAPGTEVSDGRDLNSGTSFAAPLVTGSAGLLWSINEDLYATEVRRMLLDSADPDPFAGTGAKTGRGLLDAGAASELAVSSLSVPEHSLLEATLEQGEEASFTVNVPVPESGVNALDVVICNDVSGSYSDDIATFKTKATEVVAALAENVADVYFGLATFCDFPFYPYGSEGAGDTAFDLKLRLTGELPDFYAAVDALTINSGADGPESQLEAFYQLATGEGRDLNDDGDFDDLGEISPTNVGWRPGALRVVILATDAEFHDSDLEPDYPGAGFTDTVAALTDANIMVLGLYTGSYAEADLLTVADATRGAVFPLAGDSSNMVDAITEALDLALSSVRVSIDVLNDPEGFVQNPEMLWYDNVAPGETVAFDINLMGMLQKSVKGDQTFRLISWALVNDSGLIMRIPMNITVPGATKVLSP